MVKIMILSFTEGSKAIPHFQNIVDIHSNLPPILQSLSEYNPIYAGGYPMSLVFAPRISSQLKIQAGYYHDYDIYFPTQEDLTGATSRLDTHLNTANGNRYETNNAITYKFNQPTSTEFPYLAIQIIKRVVGRPKDILSSFDFKNCAIGFLPNSKELYLHKEAPKLHLDKKLDVLNPWMIYPPEDTITDNAIIQLMRFKKYCLRWGYSLSKQSLNLLLRVYKKSPDIAIHQNQGYTATGGPYSGIRFIGTINQNLWSAMAPLLTANEHWSDNFDYHGKILPSSGDSMYAETIPLTGENDEPF